MASYRSKLYLILCVYLWFMMIYDRIWQVPRWSTCSNSQATKRLRDREGILETHRKLMVNDTLRMHCFKGEQQYVPSSQPSLCPWSALCSKPMVLPSILVPTCSTPSCGSFHLQVHEWHISKKNKHDQTWFSGSSWTPRCEQNFGYLSNSFNLAPFPYAIREQKREDHNNPGKKSVMSSLTKCGALGGKCMAKYAIHWVSE